MSSNQEAIIAFWTALEAYYSTGSFTDFNNFCFEKAEELQMDERDMNRVISAWACTLEKDPPNYLLNPKTYNNEKV